MTTFKNQSNGKIKNLWNYFTTYEKIWFIVFSLATIIVSIFIPEETTNGVSGTLLTVLYLVNVILGIMCELLTSKQSKWSFFLYIFVEIIEIVKFIMLSAMFSSMLVALFFWLPMHIISFISWNKHKDKKEQEKTVVRSLKPKHAVMLFAGVVVWTLAMGYLFAVISPDSELFSSDAVKVAVCYLDACLSALSIANGILLYFRFKENWIVWLGYIIISSVVMIITGLWVFLVLQLGYLTNTIYGYMCWTKYITSNKTEATETQATDSTVN